jgi:hypothetical protein
MGKGLEGKRLHAINFGDQRQPVIAKTRHFSNESPMNVCLRGRLLAADHASAPSRDFQVQECT